MAVEFKLPDLGEGIHEAEIVSVKIEEGQKVEEDQVIFEVETDKATVEIPSPYAGVIERIFVKEGATVTVGSVMVSFGQSGAKELAVAGAASHSATKTKSHQEQATSQMVLSETRVRGEAAQERAQPLRGGNGTSARVVHDRGRPVPAAPSVRRLARELNIDLHDVSGSGPSGRVLKEDVRAHAAGTLESRMNKVAAPEADLPAAERAPSLAEKYGGEGTAQPFSREPVKLPDFSAHGPVERVPLRSIRRKIALNMMQSWTHIPHVTHFDEVDVTQLTELEVKHAAGFKERSGGGRLTMTVLMVKAVVKALAKFPQLNSSLDEATGEIVFKRYYNIGVAVATERGLIVPVIKNADKKSVMEIARELAEMATKTREGKIELDKLQGGTFTITNIGAIGGTSMSPMINFPEAAILGMARAKKQPIVKNDQIVIGTIMPLALSFDHRLADGAEAAYFMQYIIRLLEDPFNFVLEG